MPVSDLIQAVTDGKVDVAAGIVITEQRKLKVDFTNPYLRDINTIVISNTSVPSIADFTDLSGKTVLINRGSSFRERWGV
jgi:ABC-type amino acid transport substrate-binding protein